MEPIQPTNAPAVTPPTPPAQEPAARPSREDRSLRRRALLGVAGLAGVAALTRLARAGDLSPPTGPITASGTSLGAMSAKLDGFGIQIDSALNLIDDGLSSLRPAITSDPKGVCEPRFSVTALPSSADAQFVISKPGAYYLPSNVVQVQGMVCIDVLVDGVDIDGQGFSFIGAGGGGAGGSSCIRSKGRHAFEIYDCAFLGWQGSCLDLLDCDDVCISDVLFRGCVAGADPNTGAAGALVRCGSRCSMDDFAFSLCTGVAVQLVATGFFSDGEVSDNVGRAIQSVGGLCLDDCSFVRVTGDVLVVGGSSFVSDSEFLQCDGTAVTVGPASVIEGCDCVGGTGGGFRCADGCCVEDCSVLSKEAFAIECGSRCSVSENKVVLCGGISLGSECDCCDNDLSNCSGGSDATQPMGGAINVRGGLCICEDNFVSGSRVGLSITVGGSWSTVENNTIMGAGTGGDPVAGGGAGIFVDPGATGVLCICNHVTALQGTPPYVLGTATYGPIVSLLGAGGDISAVPGSSHPMANTFSS